MVIETATERRVLLRNHHPVHKQTRPYISYISCPKLMYCTYYRHIITKRVFNYTSEYCVLSFG